MKVVEKFKFKRCILFENLYFDIIINSYLSINCNFFSIKTYKLISLNLRLLHRKTHHINQDL